MGTRIIDAQARRLKMPPASGIRYFFLFLSQAFNNFIILSSTGQARSEGVGFGHPPGPLSRRGVSYVLQLPVEEIGKC